MPIEVSGLCACRDHRVTSTRHAAAPVLPRFSLTGLIAGILLFVGLLIAKAPGHAAESEKPTLFLIGDSTVKNGTRGLFGWGTPIAGAFDPARIRVQNRALGGRSSRSYLREGLWDRVMAEIKPGDFVIIQFGHNDNGPIDSGKARASLKGNGDESLEVELKESGKKEVTHSYGWYLRKYIADTKAKGATPIVCSIVARNLWKDGKVERATDSFARWAKEAAEKGGAAFIDLNELVCRRYDELGKAQVQEFFTSADHTHTNRAGAELNAEIVVGGIQALHTCELSRYLLKPETTSAAH